MFSPEQRLSNDGGKPAPKPQQPAAPMALKKAPKKWERTFVGKGKDVKFQLRIIRDESGQLTGRYMATPGNNDGWRVEGMIREDNTFVLKGTDNNAEFEGKFSPDGKKITTSFNNKTSSGEFKVESMAMGFVVMPPRVAPKPAGNGPQGANPDSSAAGQNAETEVSPAEVQTAIKAAQETARTLGKAFTPSSKEHVEAILRHCKKAGITDINQVAYILATGIWESNGFTALREKYDSGWDPEDYFEQKYGCNPTKTLKSDSKRLADGVSAQTILAKRKQRNITELGNTKPGDGYKYRGRGYVHLTGKAGYTRAQKEIVEPSGYKIDGKIPNIVENPDLAASDRDLAGMIIAKGMMMGLFTKKSLSSYVAGANIDFSGARRVVNGTDSADVIARGAATASQMMTNNNSDQIEGIEELTDEQRDAVRNIPKGGYTQEEIQRITKGVEIGSFKGISAYYNGTVEKETWGNNFGAGGLYYGFKWQCVEFVRRFTHLNSGVYLHEMGHAGTWFKSHVQDGQKGHSGHPQYRNYDIKTKLRTGSKEKPQVGDIIVIGTSTFGHVAIIAEVNDDSIVIVQQNVETKFSESISMANKNGKWILESRVLCWIRPK
ncbi:CHAP domain-containing protein [Deinococcus aquaedulcis]|uniref:CHAP domain-containing protein n=1 Tax=Deinococcus aquaedulcis TaxID=2840455 RepID=UPI001C83AF72|nr:CHAP domain-containing protein [Deinococcus aquaedulcis]